MTRSSTVRPLAPLETARARAAWKRLGRGALRVAPRALRVAPWALRAAPWLPLLLLLAGQTLRAQTNFQPLERGEYTEEEERVLVLKGVETGLKYAIRLHDLDSGDATGEQETTRVDQDIRLELKTAFHRDVAVHLVLEPFQQPLTDNNIRREPDTNRGRESDGQTFAINAREAYLRYNFNPNSGLIFGRQQVTLADRQGMVYTGIAPGVTFDCRIGTWCMPFGALKINEPAADWLYHWGLTYTAWDLRPADDLPHALQVGIYRYYYTEHNVPLSRSGGPGFFDPQKPTVPLEDQVTDDAGNPIYYDVHGHAIFGLNVNWEIGSFIWNLNFANSQGSRVYHRFRAEGTGIPDMAFDSRAADDKVGKKVQGWAYQNELSWRWTRGLLGLRMLHATGDQDYNERSDGENFLQGRSGYYEITPGSYGGTRLWFNGSDAQVDGGAGLGHSINNTRMIGLFWNFEDRETNKVGYSGGLYDLRRVYSVIDAKGEHQSYIGVEWDNMLTWFFHKSAHAQFELNVLQQGGAFSYNDYTPPDGSTDLVVQTVARLVYEF